MNKLANLVSVALAVSMALALAAVTTSCASDDADASAAPTGPIDRTVTLAPPTNGYQLVTAPYEVPPLTEIELCSVVRLEPKGDERYAWVNRFESMTSKGSHHMNVLIGKFSFLDGYLGRGASEAALGTKLGQVPCKQLKLMESAFPVFPSQRQNQQIEMPKGVAIPMTTPLVLVFSHHFVNYEQVPVVFNAALNVETVDAAEVEQVAGLIFDGATVDVPVGTRTISQRTCVFERDVNVGLVSTHTHAWTECATLHRVQAAVAGPTVEAAPFYVNRAWDQPPIVHFQPGTFAVKAGDGVHFACHYLNNTERTLINDGTAEGEMCVFAAVVYPLAWTVPQVTEVLASGQLDKLIGFMGEALGGCDAVRDDLASPWPKGSRPIEGSTSTCKGLPQTESNLLYP